MPVVSSEIVRQPFSWAGPARYFLIKIWGHNVFAAEMIYIFHLKN